VQLDTIAKIFYEQKVHKSKMESSKNMCSSRGNNQTGRGGGRQQRAFEGGPRRGGLYCDFMAHEHKGGAMSKIVIAGLENIAVALGCSKKTLYKWIRDKEFPAFKLDGIWRVMPRDAEEWLALQRAAVRDDCWQ